MGGGVKGWKRGDGEGEKKAGMGKEGGGQGGGVCGAEEIASVGAKGQIRQEVEVLRRGEGEGGGDIGNGRAGSAAKSEGRKGGTKKRDRRGGRLSGWGDRED